MFYELNIDRPPPPSHRVFKIYPRLSIPALHLTNLLSCSLCILILVYVCPGAQQQQPAVFEVSEPGRCRPVCLQGHRAPDWSGRD